MQVRTDCVIELWGRFFMGFTEFIRSSGKPGGKIHKILKCCTEVYEPN
jgi:hypothetical protein